MLKATLAQLLRFYGTRNFYGKGNASILALNIKTNKKMINANDQLREYNCSDNFYNYNFGLTISEGVLALAQKFECFWFIDIIASYQRDLRAEEFQVWKLIKHDGDKATVSCEDGNQHTLKSQKIEYTDFKADEATVWVEFGTAILPSEH